MKAGKIPYHPDGDADDWQTVEGALDGLRGSRVSGPTPASSTDNALARWDGTDGRTLQNSAATLDNDGNLTLTGGGQGDVTSRHITASNITRTGFDTLSEQSAPSTPASGKVAFYPKSDGRLYELDDAGAERGLSPVGRQTVWVPATAMIGRTTNGAAAGTTELSSNKIMFKTLDFDTNTQEFAQFQIRMPKSWNESTVTFQPVWSHAATVTDFGVVWGLEAVAISNDDAGDAAFGSAQTSTDTGGTTDDIYIGPESSAITIGGTPQEGDWVVFQVKRVPSDGSDTLAVDARLHGISLFITTNAATDV